MRFSRCVGLALLVLAVATGTASAQARVRVTKDQSVIWVPGFTAPATVVNAGTVLDVVARRDNWYEVILPTTGTTKSGDHGFIAVSQVDLIAGVAPLQRPTTPQVPAAPVGGQLPRGPSASQSSATRVGIRGFGEIGYGWMQAHQTFRAIFDRPGAAWWGGGAELRLKPGLIVQSSVRRFRGTGQRVYVFDGAVTKTGVPDTVTITPVDLTLGYRSARGRGASYVGAGIGRFFYTETFAFADPSENLSLHFTSFHVMVGFEQRSSAWLATAFEVQYTHVPNALSSNVAQAFSEHNLGGVEARVRLIVGK